MLVVSGVQAVVSSSPLPCVFIIAHEQWGGLCGNADNKNLTKEEIKTLLHRHDKYSGM